jgi:hypothetical protein
MLLLKFMVLAMASICIANPIENSKDDRKASGLTNYDQRQTGKYNLHVNIKDVQFFAISDSLAGIGGDYESDYGDYAPLESEDSDYDISHLTVNPIFAFLGSKPTSPKPSTTTTTAATESTTLKPDPIKVQETTTTSKTSVNNQPSTTDATVSIKQDIESESKPDSTSTNKITTTSETTKKPSLPPKVNETIDYEEIPVEVLYYRNQAQKEQQAKRRHDNGNLIGNRSKNNKRQPAVVVIDDYGRNSNVKILSDNSAPASVPMVKICGRGEFRDQLGRCRVRSLLKRDANQHHVRVPGL